MTLIARSTAIAALFLTISSADAATVAGTATVAGKPAAYAVVYFEAPSAPPPATPPPRVVMDQKNLAFAPHILPVARGTVVEFTNSDDVQHNVFSPSAISGKFNLGTYGPGATRTVTLDQSGDVLVLCNIHMEMEAHILVLDDPYFATVAEDGTYTITDLPAGTYTVKIWQGRWLPFTQTVELSASGTSTVNIAAGK